MKRRMFLTLLGSAATWPIAARSQQAGKIPRLGYLTGDSESIDLPRRRALIRGLHELGYDEGRTLIVEYRSSAGNFDKLKSLADEFVRLKVDLMFAFTGVAIAAAAKAMPTTPIVGISPDPVAAGLVATLARPGGNITGLSLLAGPELYGKYAELLKDLIPNFARVAILSNPTNQISALAVKATKSAAPALGASVLVVEARQPDDFEGALAAAVKERADGLIVIQDAMFVDHRVRLAHLAADKRLPAIYGIRDHVEAGGLMAYSANRPELFFRAASIVDKIFKGAKPADIPIEQPTKFELVINMKTAKALGIAVPLSLLYRANELIE